MGNIANWHKEVLKNPAMFMITDFFRWVNGQFGFCSFIENKTYKNLN
jgi:hypothetical protein